MMRRTNAGSVGAILAIRSAVASSCIVASIRLRVLSPTESSQRARGANVEFGGAVVVMLMGPREARMRALCQLRLFNYFALRPLPKSEPAHLRLGTAYASLSVSTIPMNSRGSTLYGSQPAGAGIGRPTRIGLPRLPPCGAAQSARTHRGGASFGGTKAVGGNQIIRVARLRSCESTTNSHLRAPDEFTCASLRRAYDEFTRASLRRAYDEFTRSRVCGESPALCVHWGRGGGVNRQEDKRKLRP